MKYILAAKLAQFGITQNIDQSELENSAIRIGDSNLNYILQVKENLTPFSKHYLYISMICCNPSRR